MKILLLWQQLLCRSGGHVDTVPSKDGEALEARGGPRVTRCPLSVQALEQVPKVNVELNNNFWHLLQCLHQQKTTCDPGATAGTVLSNGPNTTQQPLQENKASMNLGKNHLGAKFEKVEMLYLLTCSQLEA